MASYEAQPHGGFLKRPAVGDPKNPGAGRPKGSKNRSTVMRRILEEKGIMLDKIHEQLSAVFPDIKKELTIEEVISYAQVYNATVNMDTASYKAVLDSAYGSVSNVGQAEEEPTATKPEWLGVAASKGQDQIEAYED